MIVKIKHLPMRVLFNVDITFVPFIHIGFPFGHSCQVTSLSKFLLSDLAISENDLTGVFNSNYITHYLLFGGYVTYLSPIIYYSPLSVIVSNLNVKVMNL
jgi:hypothetical protein